MPTALKFLTGMALFCIFLLLKATIPGMFGTFSYQGEVLEYDEIWAQGFGLPLILIGVFVPLAGLSLIVKWPYSRHFYCLVISLVVLLPAVLSGNYFAIPVFLIVPVSTTIYLFKSNEVKRYYVT
jgi:hypothetical protein